MFDERRKADRRGRDRHGKYDRRKNRCVHCAFFQRQEPTKAGFCNVHTVPITPDTFACPHFQKIKPPGSAGGVHDEHS